MNSLGIYIHVPFCGRKCPYCDFYSLSYDRFSAENYVNAVLRNLTLYSDKSVTTDTVYFGGGTPSLLTAAQIDDILCGVRRNFLLDENAEITLEANPGTLSPEKLRELHSTGVNRLSFGVQSMLGEELKLLGRTHSADRAAKAVCDAAEVGFTNISCDLMTALPEQTPEKLRRSAELLTQLPIQHVSAYILKAEEGTPFAAGKLRNSLPDDDTAAELYLETVSLLEERGFMQYEVSNFARKGFESRHNCRYWKCLDYIGIGPSAHSCYKGKRFAVPRDLAGFILSPMQTTVITDEAPCGFEEYTMLRLRLTEGLDLNEVPEHRSDIEKKLPALINAGLVRHSGSRISLTPAGFLVSNSVIERLIF